MSGDEEEDGFTLPRGSSREGVKPISLEDLDKLAIGPGNKLYWGGAPVRASAPLKVGAVLVVVGTVVGGVGSFASAIISYDFYESSLSSSPSRQFIEDSYRSIGNSLQSIEAHLAKAPATVESSSEQLATTKALQDIASSLDQIRTKFAVAQNAVVPVPSRHPTHHHRRRS